MDQLQSQPQRPFLIHGPASDPLDYYWLTTSLPDGLYVVPPDAATASDEQALRSADLLLAAVALTVGLLAVLVAFAVAVA